MASQSEQSRCVHTKHLGGDRYRDLEVYYEKGGMNYWSNDRQPKGIYFASQSYERNGSSRSYSVGPGSAKDSGYVLVAPLKNYRPSVLAAVREHVARYADQIHAHLQAGENTAAIELIKSVVDAGFTQKAAA